MTAVSQKFEFVGGNLALDFVNTVHSGADTLEEPGSIAQWVRAANLGKSSGARLTRRLMELRQTLTSIARALADGAKISRRDLTQLNDTLAECPPRVVLHVSDDAIVRETAFVSEKLDDLAGPLAAAMADLLTSPDRTRVKRCPGCAMYFVDESRNRTRTWCSMKSCGNRAKVAAHYQRSRGEAS